MKGTCVFALQFWRIVDCTDDLAWALFYYAGAASAAGQSYSGAVLVTPDGAWPAEVYLGMRLWEVANPEFCGSAAPVAPRVVPVSAAGWRDGLPPFSKHCLRSRMHQVVFLQTCTWR